MMGEQRITFTVEGNVVPWQRMGRSKSSRIDGRGVRTYKPKKVAEYQSAVHGHAMKAIQKWRLQNRKQWQGIGSFAMSLDFRQQDRIARDVDNLVKCIMDGLGSLVYNDDKQVNELHVTRRLDRENPGVTVTVWRHIIDRMVDP